MSVPNTVFQVGDWTVTPRRCTLETDGKAVHVKPKSMAVLQCLAAASGEVVTRDELFETVWPNIVVTDDVLTQCIVELRKAVGDTPRAPKFIETVPKIGFRLVPRVVPIDNRSGSSARRWVPAGIVALVILAVLVFAYQQWVDTVTPIRTVAVLPLTSLSDDPDEAYFAYGITDLLTTELGQISELGVISRTSADVFGGSSMTLPEIGRELGADALIEGSVQAEGNEVLINLQLIDARTDQHLWSRPYRRNVHDIFTLQGEVAQEIADEIAVALTPQMHKRLTRGRQADPEAIRLWMVGILYMKSLGRTDGLELALQKYKEAVALDPDFAQGYASMATAYVFQGSWIGRKDPKVVLPLAISAAHRALELDPYLADAHFALGQVHWLNRQWEAAEREYRKGYELNPSSVIGLTEYANFLTAMGRTDEAIEFATQAVRIAPLDPIAYNELAFAYWTGGRLEQALAWFEKSLEIDPDFKQTVLLIPELYIDLGQPDKAEFYLDKFREDFNDHLSQDIGYAASTYIRLGREDIARELLADLLERRESGQVRAFAVALIYNSLGETETALDWLETAYEEQDISLIWLKDDIAFDELREHPRFKELVSRLEFPD